MNKKNLDSPGVAVDIVIFNLISKKLHVLLIKMNKEPYVNNWALPGGLVQTGESLDTAALRNLSECTSVQDVYLKQFHTFGDPQRDIHSHVVSVAYFALIDNPKLKIINDPRYLDIKWFDTSDLPQLAYDHLQIINKASGNLKNELEYTDIVFKLLPTEFTLRELQDAYEIILGEKLDKRNFRKKIASRDILEDLNKIRIEKNKYKSRLYMAKTSSNNGQ